MALTCKEITDAVGLLLNDVDGERWDNSQLLGWIHEAQIAIATLTPSLVVSRVINPVVAGARQTIPVDGFRLWRVLGPCDVSGVVAYPITPISEDQLYMEDPGWMTATVDVSPVVFHYMKTREPSNAYYLYPVGTAVAYVLMDYIPTLSLPVSINASLAAVFNSRHLPVFVDYVLHRCFATDSDAAPDKNKSDGYFAAFKGKLAELVQHDRGVME